jgi:purine-nucleoside/S-methyl-5'-thioadenosine phosphorylase / adenosine deaminase
MSIGPAAPAITASCLMAPGIRHGFFTRAGGVSTGLYDSLNIGGGSRDDRANVIENRARAMAAFDLPGSALVTAYQIHSTTALTVAGPWPDAPPHADGLATDKPGVALGILTADCAPILLVDPDAKVIGAAHAGWRGAVGGIGEATVTAMESLGAARRRIHAAVGPCIGVASYEVGPEFPAPFLAADPGNERFFRTASRDGHFMFDLAGYVASRLAALGLGAVETLRFDTCANEERFFSYRRSCLRNEADYGRELSAIVLAP